MAFSNQKKLGRSKLGIILGVVLIAAGALAGFVAHANFLSAFRASSSIFLGENPQLKSAVDANRLRLGSPFVDLKRVLERLRTPEEFDRFVRARELQNDEVARSFKDQMLRGSNQPTSFSTTYPLTRADIRDLPEVITREALKNSTLNAYLLVSVDHRSAEEALRRGKIIVDYARDGLLRAALLDTMRETLLTARNDEARLMTQISTNNWTIQSLKRQTGEMQEIRQRHLEGEASQGEDRAALRDTIQVPADPRFLSPLRQIVGLEVKRAELEELHRMDTARQAYASSMGHYSSKIIVTAEEEGSAAKLLDFAFAELERLDSPSAGSDERYAISEARNTLRQSLVDIRGKYVERPPDPVQPTIVRIGPSLTAAIGGGAILGFLVWLGLGGAHMARRWT